MKNIALIGCSSRKKGKNEPDKKYKASEIYVGNNFIHSVKEGLKEFNCEEYYILSGNMDYGLLHPDDQIQYYNVYLSNKNIAYQREWAQKVIKQLKERFPLGFDDINFIFFAGQGYYKNLISSLPNWTTLKYNGRHITFEIKEKK